MKIKPTVKKKTLPDGVEIISVSHSQFVRLSHNYNSAECSYSVTVSVKPGGDHENALKLAEQVVEKQLTAKVADQRGFLENLANGK